MSQPWKLLPLAAIVAVVGALLVVPGGAMQPNSAMAEFADCPSDQGTLIIQIFDDNTDDLLAVEGSRVELVPDPQDASGARDYTDGGGEDADNEPGQITINDACADDGNDPSAEYEAFFENFPSEYEDCDIIDDTDVDFAPEDNESLTLTLEVDCSDVELTPTATPTGTAGPADEITVTASPTSVSCSGTSIITIQVRDEDGDPVPTGTEVEISATIGTITPSAGQTVDDSGDAFVFWQAPANQGGTATITAESGDAEGTTNVTANCGATPTPSATTAPPPTVGAGGGGGVISPPNTGSGGLAVRDEGTGWLAIAGIALLIATTLGAASVARVRA